MNIKPGFYRIAVVTTGVVIVTFFVYIGFAVWGVRSQPSTVTDTASSVGVSKTIYGVSKAEESDYLYMKKDTLMSYSGYRRLEDSLKRRSEYKEYIKNSVGSGFYGKGIALGFRSLSECDTCQDFLSAFNKGVPETYIVLGGYYLSHEGWHTYFIEKGKPFLESVIWAKPKTGGLNIKTDSGYFAYKQLPFRYAEKEQLLLIPCTPARSEIIRNGYWLTFILVTIFYLIVIFVLPLKILLNISKGNVFTKRNISSLHFISYTLFAVALISPLISIALRFLFGIYRFPEFRYDYWSLVDKNYVAFIAALIVLGIAKAFSKGFQIQQEQDLTV